MKSKLLRAMLDWLADKSIGNYCWRRRGGEIFLKSGAGEGNRIMAVISHNSLNCSITVHSKLPNLDIPASKSTVTNEH